MFEEMSGGSYYGQAGTVEITQCPGVEKQFKIFSRFNRSYEKNVRFGETQPVDGVLSNLWVHRPETRIDSIPDHVDAVRFHFGMFNNSFFGEVRDSDDGSYLTD